MRTYGPLTALSVLLFAPRLMSAAPAVPFAPPTPVSLSAQASNRVQAFTAWDDGYLYMAIQVNKPALNGRNSRPFSNPLEDDAVIVSLQTDDDHTAQKRTVKTAVVAVSVAGGAQLYRGPDATPLFSDMSEIAKRLDDIKAKETDPTRRAELTGAVFASLLKFAVTQKGALLPSGSFAPGYTVEVAIPWADLGGKPAPGTRMAFNIAAQSTVGGSPALQALAPKVAAKADLDNPSLWEEMLFVDAPVPAQADVVECLRVKAKAPVMDGDIGTAEWDRTGSVEFGERLNVGAGPSSLVNTLGARVAPPYQPNPSRPAVALPPTILPDAVPAHTSQALAPMIFAKYRYDFQGDPRRDAPAQNVMRPDGASAMTHHPLEGCGPWFSYTRPDWHRKQLIEMRRAGIDVVLPIYRGAARDRQLYADEGLRALSTAMLYLQQIGQNGPQAALYLDTTALIDTFTNRPDLAKPEVQAALYLMIRDFYRQIPASCRFSVALAGSGNAYPVFLSSASAFSGLDNSAVTYLRRRFMADFDGADLLLIGASDFKPALALDGYFPQSGAWAEGVNTDGWIKMAGVNPGYDNSATLLAPDALPTLRSRRDGAVYQTDWQQAVAHHPNWVLVDSWNDFSNASEIAPSVEEGYAYSDRTRAFSRLFNGGARIACKFVGNNLPARLVAGRSTRVTVRIENTGTTTWSAKPGEGQAAMAFGWRLMQGDRAAATGAATPAVADIAPEQVASVEVPVVPDASVAPGAYRIEIFITETGKVRGLGAFEGDPAMVCALPVSVIAPADAPKWGATLVQSDVPLTMENGAVYSVNAMIRNDGSVAWRSADSVRVGLRLYRSPKASENPETPVETADASVSIPKDIAPGETGAVRVSLPVMTADGKPLPACSAADDWNYTVRYEVSGGGATAEGVAFGATPVTLAPFDFGAGIFANIMPNSLPAAHRVPVRLTLKNNGPSTWKKDLVRVGYHWYYDDGAEYIWNDETTPIPQDVAPGATAPMLMAWVTAPPADGPFHLIWDLKVGDTWASTLGAGRVYDELSLPTRVVKGNMSFVDLSRAFNIQGAVEDGAGGSADFDGAGRAFPAALIPPYADAAVVPSGAWLPNTRRGADAPRLISFKWGPKDGKNFLSCRGQTLLIAKKGQQCRILHILAASSGKETIADMRLLFKEENGESEDLYAIAVSPWDRAPSYGETVAYRTQRHMEHGVAAAGAVQLYHYTVAIREPRKLEEIVLPNAPEIHIAAITIEK